MPQLSEKTLRWLAIFSASYVKRLLDSHAYDQLFETDLGKKLKALPQFQKHLAEFALHGSNIIIEEQLKSGTPFEKFLKDVLSDIPSETARRFIDADQTAPSSNPDLIDTVAHLTTPEAEELISWLATASESARSQLRSEVARQSSAAIGALLALKPETRAQLLSLSSNATETPRSPDDTGSAAPAGSGLIESLAKTIDDAARAMKTQRERKNTP